MAMKLARICLVLLMLALLPVMSVQAATTTVTTIETIPFSTVFEGCGDIISIDGEIQHVFHMTISDSGRLVLQDLFHPQGLTGIGLLSGATYHAVGETKSITTVSADSTFTFTEVNNFKIISAGTTANYVLHETLHLTFNAKGELTASTDNFSLECRG
jgi:hypothetical protein